MATENTIEIPPATPISLKKSEELAALKDLMEPDITKIVHECLSREGKRDVQAIYDEVCAEVHENKEDVSDMVKKYDQMVVNVLGRDYTIRITLDDPEIKNNRTLAGYCSMNTSEICIRDFAKQERYKGKSKEWIAKHTEHILRHEFMHAFLSESGLARCSATSSEPWAVNEEMIDWFALQYDKISAVFEKLKTGLLTDDTK